MQVAEAVDGEDVHEHGDEHNVGDEADQVAAHVREEVNGAHYYWNHVDGEHDDAAQDQDGKVCFAQCNPLLVFWKVFLFMRSKSLSAQVEDNPDD